jgi:2-succinyl-5-enolpyruvyl-6-hydroxy-3-cyclohexene-1-carboxylate synthase
MTDPAVTTAWVRGFVDELARLGVGHVCIAPGSRSTPLVMAFAREDRIRKWVHLDERCAGFFALGLAKTTRRPAAVVTTSGTATANLFPAVIEASQAGVPMLVLTADRPPVLRGTDANQTIDQCRLYGSFARESLDAGAPSDHDLRGIRMLACRAVAATMGMDRGPVHVNFPFEKPLEPVELSVDRAATLRSKDPIGLDGHPNGAPIVPILDPGGPAPVEEEVRAVLAVLSEASRGLIVAGPVSDPDAVGPAVGDLACATGFPVLADPLSGARYSEHCAEYAVTAYDILLEGPAPSSSSSSLDPWGRDTSLLHANLRAALKPDVVIRVGASPVSSSLLAFLGELEDVPQIRITSGHCWKDHLGRATLDVRAEEAPFLHAVTRGLSAPGAPARWREQWRALDRAAKQEIAAYRDSPAREPLESDIIAAVVAEVAEGTTLFVSNSMPVRDLDTFGGGGKPLRVYGNRGASGIDGIVSTVAGIAAAGDRPSPVLAVVGDIAFYHDMNGLLSVAKQELDIVFVVINNDGGGIFHELPIRDHEPEFTQYFVAPPGLDFRHAAELYGIPYRRADDPADLSAALREVLAGTGPRIFEVRSDRNRNEQGREALGEGVRRAVTAVS